jgi:hypothetical protein
MISEKELTGEFILIKERGGEEKSKFVKEEQSEKDVTTEEELGDTNLGNDELEDITLKGESVGVTFELIEFDNVLLIILGILGDKESE